MSPCYPTRGRRRSHDGPVEPSSSRTCGPDCPVRGPCYLPAWGCAPTGPHRNRTAIPITSTGSNSDRCSTRRDRSLTRCPATASSGGTLRPANRASAVRRASVWCSDYPGSVVTRPGQSVIATWSDPHLWDALVADGDRTAAHRAGEPRGRAVEGRGSIHPAWTAGSIGSRSTSTLRSALRRSTRGWSPSPGRMVASSRATSCPCTPAPGPTSASPCAASRDYPGMYTMGGDRPLRLGPAARSARRGAGAAAGSAAEQLTRKGYLPGLINSNDAASGARSWSGWSASGPVRRSRRQGPPLGVSALLQTDPADPQLARSLLCRAARHWRRRGQDRLPAPHPRRRLDAVPFLGIEPRPGATQTWHYQHPLSFSATNYLRSLIRKMGGWSFQELNVPLESLKSFTRNGPDLSYDFFTRAQCLHALLTGDAAPLRLAFRWLLEEQVQPLTLVHDLQNHDEITYQLVEPDHRKDSVFVLGGQKMTGKQMRQRMLEQMRSRVAGPAAPYNKLYRPETRWRRHHLCRVHCAGGWASTTRTTPRPSKSADPPGPPVAGGGERPSAGGVQPVELGRGRRPAHLRRRGQAAYDGRRLPMDQPRRRRSHGSQLERDRVRLRPAASEVAVRLAA